MNETLKIIEESLDYNKNAQNFFLVASKVDKGKSEPKPEESIAQRVKIKKRLLKLKKRKKHKQ